MGLLRRRKRRCLWRDCENYVEPWTGQLCKQHFNLVRPQRR